MQTVLKNIVSLNIKLIIIITFDCVFYVYCYRLSSYEFVFSVFDVVKSYFSIIFNKG
jgi:hypothetical protein